MSFCTHCGAERVVGDVFCRKCGFRPPRPLIRFRAEDAGDPHHQWDAPTPDAVCAPTPLPSLDPVGEPAEPQHPPLAVGPVDELCPYCIERVNASTPAVVCDGCGTAYHQGCWDRERGCVHRDCARWRLASLARRQ